MSWFPNYSFSYSPTLPPPIIGGGPREQGRQAEELQAVRVSSQRHQQEGQSHVDS